MLSIVIATWNSGKTMRRCLASVTPFLAHIDNVVIVDNCSSDDTLAIAREILPADKLDCISEPDAGIYDAFNKGVRHARGNSIYFLGSDDYLLPGFEAMLSDARLGHMIVVGAVRQEDRVIRHSARLPGLHLLYSNIPHQGMFIPRATLQHFPYSLRYRVLSDYAWNLSHFWSKPNQYAFRSELCCEWSIGGISGNRPDPAFSADKASLIDQHAPAAIRHMYRAFRTIKGLLK